MSGMVAVSGEALRRLRAAGVVARRGLGGVLEGFWVPAWCVEVEKWTQDWKTDIWPIDGVTPSPTELRWVLYWIVGADLSAYEKLPHDRLEDVADDNDRLQAARASYLFGGWSCVSDLVDAIKGHRGSR